MGSNNFVTLVFEHLLDIHLNKDVIQLPLEYASKYCNGNFIVITRPNLFQKQISERIKIRLVDKIILSNHVLYQNKKFENLVSFQFWFLKACLISGFRASTVFMYPFYGNPFLGSLIIRLAGLIKLKRVKVILKLDSYFDVNVKMSRKQIFNRSIEYLFFDKIISDKELTFECVNRIYYFFFYRKLIFIPNCTSNVYDEQMNFVRKEPDSYVFVGRVAEDVKNFKSLFNSWINMHQNGIFQNEFLYVCGMIPEELLKEYQTKLRNIHKPNIVRFLGDLQTLELKEILLKSNIFISTSLKEGSPISIQEAIKCKCGLILPDISNFSELLCGHVGLIHEPINEINIMKTIKGVISDPESFNQQKTVQYKKYSNNSWKNYIHLIHE